MEVGEKEEGPVLKGMIDMMRMLWLLDYTLRERA